jgi:hypothetical protein
MRPNGIPFVACRHTSQCSSDEAGGGRVNQSKRRPASRAAVVVAAIAFTVCALAASSAFATPPTLTPGVTVDRPAGNSDYVFTGVAGHAYRFDIVPHDWVPTSAGSDLVSQITSAPFPAGQAFWDTTGSLASMPYGSVTYPNVLRFIAPSSGTF